MYIYHSYLNIYELNEKFNYIVNYSFASNFCVLRIEALRGSRLLSETIYNSKFDFYNTQFVKIRIIIKKLFL
jgi:hypothetical protein